MIEAQAHRPRESPVGTLLKRWRGARRLSQLALATEAEISARHLSFIETGRANPSREMLLVLASTLNIPLRERNALLLAAGFAPLYRESQLDAPELAAVRQALDAILRQHEPFPAVVMNRCWDVVARNEAARVFFGWLLGPPGPGATAAPPNVLRLMFHPEKLRPFVANWEAVGEALIGRAHRESLAGVPDEATRQVLSEVLSYPGVPRAWKILDPEARLLPVVPVLFRKDGRELDFFSTVTTLGTAQDITLQELRIECFHPANESTRLAASALQGHCTSVV